MSPCGVPTGTGPRLCHPALAHGMAGRGEPILGTADAVGASPRDWGCRLGGRRGQRGERFPLQAGEGPSMEKWDYGHREEMQEDGVTELFPRSVTKGLSLWLRNQAHGLL